MLRKFIISERCEYVVEAETVDAAKASWLRRPVTRVGVTLPIVMERDIEPAHPRGAEKTRPPAKF